MIKAKIKDSNKDEFYQVHWISDGTRTHLRWVEAVLAGPGTEPWFRCWPGRARLLRGLRASDQNNQTPLSRMEPLSSQLWVWPPGSQSQEPQDQPLIRTDLSSGS